MKKRRSVLQKTLQYISSHRDVFFVAFFAIIGVALLIDTSAATSTATFEGEAGSRTPGVGLVSDGTASGGQAITFQATSTSTDFHTCFPHAFCTPSNQPVTMNGVNIRFVGESAGTNSTSLTQMNKIKSKGFNSVRLVLDWEAYQPNAGVGGFNATAFSNLRTVVNNAKTAGVYVILDPIHFGSTGTSCGTYSLCIPVWARVSVNGTYQGSAKSVQANARDYIEKIMTEYGDEPNVVAVDLVNEPKPDPFADDVLISMYNTLIGWARAKDSDKILMIESNSGDKLYSVTDLSKLTVRDNIVFSFHHYSGGVRNSDGSIISGCGATGYSGSGWPCGNRTYENQKGYVVVRPDELLAHLQANQYLIASAGMQLPIWIGEWGIIEGGANSVQWRKDMTAMFKQNNIGRAYWMFNNSAANPPETNMSMTLEGSSTPGDWKSWVIDAL